VPPLKYLRPRSLAEAGALLREHPQARLLAGGMTLIPSLKLRLLDPSHLVDIGRLEELAGIHVEGGRLTIGAGTRHDVVANHELVRRHLPALAGLAGRIGDPMVRNRGTLGGSVANNDPAADYPAALLGCGAVVHTTRGRHAAADFFQGLFATALAEGDIVTRIEFPLPRAAAYAKFHHPASGYAMAGVWVSVTATGAVVAVTGAGSGVFRWREAEAALGASLHERSLAELWPDSAELLSDLHGDAAYRAQLVHTMAREAVARLP